jgi:hypothetical protein
MVDLHPDRQILVTAGAASKLSGVDQREPIIGKAAPVAFLRTSSGKLKPLYLESLVDRICQKLTHSNE